MHGQWNPMTHSHSLVCIRTLLRASVVDIVKIMSFYHIKCLLYYFITSFYNILFIRCFIIQQSSANNQQSHYHTTTTSSTTKNTTQSKPKQIQPNSTTNNHNPNLNNPSTTPIATTGHQPHSPPPLPLSPPIAHSPPPPSDQPKLQQKKTHNQRETKWKADIKEREEGKIDGGLGVRIERD